MAGSKSVVLPQLEFIRLAAMVEIFLYHVWSVLPGVLPPGLVEAMFRRGYLGVVVFNVVTGLVLALPHLGPEARPRPTYPEFLRRRFLRICPNYFIALIALALVNLLLGAPAEKLLPSLAAHLAFVHTLSPATFFDIAPAYWWLGLLAQFYLSFPLLLALFQRLGPAKAALGLCLACWGGWSLVLLIAAGNPESPLALLGYMLYFNLPARLPEFAIGMWLASSITRRPDQTAGLPPGSPMHALALAALLAALAGSALEATFAPLEHITLVSWCLTAFFIAFSLPQAATAGRLKTVAALAAASYSFYLVHQPVLAWLASPLSILGQTPAFMGLILLGAPLSYLLAKTLDRAVAILSTPRKA